MSNNNKKKEEKKDDKNKEWKFWKTQPVAQTTDEATTVEGSGRPIDKEKDPVKDIMQTPYPLPPIFEWHSVEIDEQEQLSSVYRLLRDHYVEDDDNMFRFDYSQAFLKWALKPPGYRKEWHLAVRMKDNKALVGFISAIPATICVYGKDIKMVEINFLCVHSNLRTNRLAPVLIKEITRRVNVTGVFQAVYTAGITLPTPIASCQYYHRSLNPKKLIDVKFSYLRPRMNLARTIKLYKLPDKIQTPNLRPLKKEDCPSACELLNNYLQKFKVYMKFSNDDFEHWFTPVENVIDCYVVEDPQTNKITDMISFYHLPSTIINHKEHSTLKAAYSWYNVATTIDLVKLVNDSLILAKTKDFDVFNCLAIHDNEKFFSELKFGPGDGHLQYYLYNWLAKPMEAKEVGLVLL